LRVEGQKKKNPEEEEEEKNQKSSTKNNRQGAKGAEMRHSISCRTLATLASWRFK
jgi:hypothetical protein